MKASDLAQVKFTVGIVDDLALVLKLQLLTITLILAFAGTLLILRFNRISLIDGIGLGRIFEFLCRISIVKPQ